MHKKRNKYDTYLNPVFIIPVLFTAHTLLLRSFGRNLICWCNNIKFFIADSNSPEGSQQLFDFYSFSHIIHGIIFYALLWKFARKLSLRSRFLIAVLIEMAWEVIENTPMIINHYRQGAVSETYNGDSVINSLMDIVSMILGFYLARRLPLWGSILAIILMEVIVGLLIHDNLTLNILLFIYPFKFIQAWQSGV